MNVWKCSFLSLSYKKNVLPAQNTWGCNVFVGESWNDYKSVKRDSNEKWPFKFQLQLRIIGNYIITVIKALCLTCDLKR